MEIPYGTRLEPSRLRWTADHGVTLSVDVHADGMADLDVEEHLEFKWRTCTRRTA
jgi:hypothetical protein